LAGNPEAQFVAEVSNPVIIVPIANAGSAAGRTVAACALRAARTARAGVRAGSAAAIAAAGVKVGTDGANAEGRLAGSAGLLAVAAAVGDHGNGKVCIALASVAPRPTRVPAAEAIVNARGLTPESARAAGDAVRETIKPIDDHRAHADYRRDAAGTMVTRLLLQLTAPASTAV
jgi:hypothetical protein